MNSFSNYRGEHMTVKLYDVDPPVRRFGIGPGFGGIAESAQGQFVKFSDWEAMKLAYAGAREDLAIWEKRALAAEQRERERQIGQKND